MTQQTSTCRQPAKLVWEDNSASTAFGTEYKVIEIEGRYRSFHLVQYLDLGLIGEYNNEEDGKAACQADYDRRWTEGSEPIVFEDTANDLDYLKEQTHLDCPCCNGSGHVGDTLTKLQPRPEGFWKPIEQCPKVEAVQYFLYHETCGPTVGGAHVAYRKHGYTYYAEIPVGEVQS